MSNLIKNGALVADSWQIVALAEGETPETVALPGGDLIVPLAVWSARQEELNGRDRLGLLLEPSDDPATIAGDVQRFAVIAVRFPKFVDGRGYSTATLLRTRYGFTGELRAVGDVLIDQLFFYQRCGFDAFALRDDKSVDSALVRLTPFPDRYQTSVDTPQPLFRRRAA
jgi:uncharacterized protein (DUF934 family)